MSPQTLNSLTPGWFGIKQMLRISNPCEIRVNTTEHLDDYSTLVQVMASCRPGTWVKVDPDLWRYMSSLGRNELINAYVDAASNMWNSIQLLQTTPNTTVSWLM